MLHVVHLKLVLISENARNVIFYLFFSRYHYNVVDARLHQHIEKAAEDGLYISSVASASNLWALIMDAGTGFSDQVYELSSVFLHKVTSCSQDPLILQFSEYCF